MSNRTVSTFAPESPMSRAAKGDFRTFTVTRPDGVDLPGCLTIDEVLLDGHPIPAFITEKVMVDATRKNHEHIDVPLYMVVDGPEGPILQRSLKSNDGRWQVGSQVSIKGTWDDDKAEDKETGAKTHAKKKCLILPTP